MADEKRLAAALRARWFFVHQRADGTIAHLGDKEIIEATEGTYLRASTELGLACQDLWREIVNEYGKHGAKFLFALGRFIRWFSRGDEDDGNRST